MGDVRRGLHADNADAMQIIRRLAPICVVALAAMLASGALAKDAKKPGPPVGVRGFVVKPSEPLTRIFSRTPAFTWQPVRGALCYEFELSTSKGFNEAAVIWSNVRYGVSTEKACTPVVANDADTTAVAPTPSASGASGPAGSTAPAPTDGTTAASSAAGGELTVIQPLRVPAVSVDVALPWFTGNPYALYGRARAITLSGATRWSKPFGFNMQWTETPKKIEAAVGLTAWTPVPGATGYELMYQGPTFRKVFATSTNVADQRELWAFHNAAWYGSVQWRVRAVRRVFGKIPNGLPAVSYGPWSAVAKSTNPTPVAGQPIRLLRGVSDVVTVPEVARAHELMPALAWSGQVGIDGQPHTLFRAYISTDDSCVNTVFRGAIVGSPAYAPRLTGPLKLPASATEVTAAANLLLEDAATEGAETRAADASKVQTSEAASSSAASTAEPGAVAAAKVDLPDVDFPSTRYYYTVVGVDVKTDAGGTVKYVEAELPQDVCQAGRVLSFGKKSRAVRTSAPAPLVLGLSPQGKLLGAKSLRPVVYSAPLVTWLPATGATAYEVQWSRTSYPWKASGKQVTYATSAVLQLPTGKWYYRVRGLNQAQLRKAEMTWSAATPVIVASPKFRLVASK
jgi:hypothetical protein